MTLKAASLTSSLLAPKGAAAPSGMVPPRDSARDSGDISNLERDQQTLRQQVAALKSSFTAIDAKRRTTRSSAAKPRAVAPQAPGPQLVGTTKQGRMPRLDDHGRVKMSLRLDTKRHLMLKLASAHLNRSAQDLLVIALDGYLKDAASSISCSQFKALVDSGEKHDRDQDCCFKKA